VPRIWSFPLTLIVALTTVLRTTVLHCDNKKWQSIVMPVYSQFPVRQSIFYIITRLQTFCDTLTDKQIESSGGASFS